MRLTKIIIAITLAASLNSYAIPCEHPQSAQLGESLRLMQKQGIDDFIIVEVPGSKNFFQFGSKGHGYVFDVPKLGLSETQLDRAEKYFLKQHIGLVTVRATNPVTGEEFYLESYQKSFEGHEIEAGVRLGICFMFEVLIHNGPVVIIRGWE
jgi:hypothetical protein